MIRRGTEERAARALAWSCVLVVVACTQQVEVAGSAPDASDMQVSAARRPSPRTATDGRESPSAESIAALDGSEAEPELVAGAMERVASDAEARGTLRSAPSALRAAFVRGRQREGASDARYQVVQERGQLVARSPERRVTGRFTSDGFHVSSDEGPRGTLRTDALRCDDVRVPAGRGAFALGDATNRVERAIGRGELVATEWIESGPLGLEQGFDVSASRCAELVVELAVEGLRAERSGDGAIEDRVRLIGDEGALAYGELFAIDADGRSLPARFAVNGRSLELVVDTRDATWPVVVDPLVYTEDQIVTPPEGLGSDGAVGDSFGYSVAIDGDLAIVGAPGDDIAGVNAGSAYVFARSGDAWVIEAKLVAEDDDARGLGSSVALSGNTALVSAANSDGSVYVFVREASTWRQQAVLVSGGAWWVSRFGCSVALSGNTALVGADSVGSVVDAGWAYVFERSGESWVLQAELAASDATLRAQFGASVAVFGDTALIGAPGDDASRGAVYEFQRTGAAWNERMKLRATDGGASDGFGRSVALAEDTAVVGAPGHTSAGAAYVFVRAATAWEQQAKLTAGDRAAGDSFGRGVSLSGDSVVVSAPGDDALGVRDVGSAYVFVRSGTSWAQQAKLVPTSPTSERLHESVAISGDVVLVSSGTARSFYSSVHRFTRSGSTWLLGPLLDAGRGAADSMFGTSVSMSESVAVVGAPGDPSSTPGTVHVLTDGPSGWELRDRLEPDPGDTRFGESVAVSGNTILIGSLGAAYAFVWNGSTCERQARLTASNADAGFGYSVALSGGTALVGAPWDVESGANAGAAYVFVRSGTVWTLQARLVAGDGADYDLFGISVGVSGDTAVVGALGDDVTWMDSGSAHVFARTGTSWRRQALLAALDRRERDEFGRAVAVDGEMALVGARRGAYVFSRGDAGWSEQAKLFVNHRSFGSSVALFGHIALVGAPSANLVGGSAHVFERTATTWTLRETLLASDGANGDDFGRSVALFGTTTLVGAPRHSGPSPYGNRSGAVYFGTVGWEGLDGQPCVAESECDSGFCVDGVCCDTACGDGATDDCQACAIAAGAAVDGVCGATTGNACDDGLACTTLDVCDAGVCDGASACDDATSCTEASGVFVCGVCPAGSFSVDGTGATECVPCATGTWSVAGATTCVPWTVCGVGSRVVSVASPSSDRECAPCEPGTFSSTTNASACVAWSDCPAGTFVREAGSATSDRTCDACVAGFSSTSNAGACAAWSECGVGEFSSSAPTSTRDRECTACSRCDEDEVEVSPCAEATDTECARVDDAGVPILDGGLDDGGLVDGSIDGSPDASDGGVSGGGGCGCHTSAPAGSAFGLLLGVGWMLFGRRRRRADRHEVTGGAITINAASGTRRAPRSTQHQVRDEYHDQRSIRTRRAPRSTQQEVRDERRDREHDRQHDREDLRD